MISKRYVVRISIFKQLITPSLSLLTSMSTFTCCALPVLLVTLGMGASLTGLLSIFPWMIIISKFKIYIFIIAGILLLVSYLFFFKERNAACPADPIQAKICLRLKTLNSVVIIISSILYFIGFFFAFIAEKVFF